MPEDKIQQDLNFITENIRGSYEKDSFDFKPSSNTTSALSLTKSEPEAMTRFSDVKFKDVYKRLNSGDFVAKYPNYSTTDLNQEERLAQQQGTGSKWVNGLAKFAGKVGTGVLGGTVGTVTGIGNLIKEGSFSTTYDNDFNKWLDDLNTQMDFNLPNYYTEAEKEKSLFSQMGTSNFWANDVLGGAAFTVSAIGSEAIWAATTGGTSLATTGARWGARLAGLYSKGSKGLKFINKAKKLSIPPILKNAKITDKVRNATLIGGKTGQFLNAARFTYTSAGFEAGFEARHYMREQEELFEKSFGEEEPTREQRLRFEEALADSANGLFATNLAIVGSSNLVMFGSVFNIKSPVKLPKKYLNRKLFGVGNKKIVDAQGKEQLKKVTANKAQKLFRGAFTFGKGAFTEGFYEEGGQGMSSGTAGAWLQSSYDKEAYKTQLDLSESMYEGFSSAYGTKEGQKEVLIGALIGTITQAGVNLASGNGVFGEFNAEDRKAGSEYAYRKSYTADKLISNIQTASRKAKAIEEMDRAEDTGDNVGAEVARKKVIYSHVTAAERFDYGKEAEKEFIDTLEAMSNEDIAEEYGLDSAEDAQEFKNTVLSEYQQARQRYKKYKEFSDYFITDKAKKEGLSEESTEVLKEAVAVELSIGEDMNQYSGEVLEAVKEELKQGLFNTKAESISKGLSIQDILSKASQETRDKFRDTRKELKATKKELERLERERREVVKKDTPNKLNETAVKIQELEEKQRVLEAENEAQLSAMVLENPFNNEDQEYITTKELDEIEKALGDVENLLEVYKKASPQKYEKLRILLRDYETVKRGLEKFSDLNRQLSDPNLGLRGKRNLIKELSLDKEPSQVTIDLLKNLQETSSNIILDQAISEAEAQSEEVTTEDLTEDEIKSFKDEGEVTDLMVSKIAKKIKSQKELTNEEEAVRRDTNDRVEAKLQELKKSEITTPEEPQNTNVESIQDIINNNAYLLDYIGTGENVNIPTEEELNRYKELLKRIKSDPKLSIKRVIDLASNYWSKKGTKITLSSKELQEFKDLNQNIKDFQLYKHYKNDSDISLAELVEQQASREQQPNEEQEVKKEVTEEDHVKLSNVTENPDAKDSPRNEAIIQTYEGVKVKKERRGYTFSHIKIGTLLSKLKGLKDIKVYTPKDFNKDGSVKSYNKRGKKISLEEVENYEGVKDIKFVASLEGKKIAFFNKSRARVNISSKDFSSFIDNTDYGVFKNALVKNNTYSDLYEESEGKYSQVSADFKMDDESGEFKEYSTQEVYNIPKGQSIFFKVNREDTWNKSLLKQYKDGKITKEGLIQQVKVYVVGNEGAIIGDLKSTDSVRNGSSKFLEVRQSAANELIRKEGGSTQLPFFTSMEFTFLGTPDTKVTKEEDGISPVELEFTEESLEEVVDYGIVKDGKLKLKNKSKKVRRDFVSELKNAPVIVFKKGSYLVAYPVSLIKKEQAQSLEFMSIINSSSNFSKKATDINNLMSEKGIDPRSDGVFYISEENQNMVSENGGMSDQLKKVKNLLDEKEKYVDPKSWVDKNHEKSSLISEAKTSINLLGKKLIGPKPVLDWKSTERVEDNSEPIPDTATPKGQFDSEVEEQAKKERDKPCNNN